MNQKVLIFLMLLSSFSVFAQASGQNQLLQGKWVFESVSVFEGNVQIPFSADNFDFKIPAEIDVQQDELTFVYKENTVKVKYDAVAGGNILCFPVCAEWKITGDKLQLQPDPDMVKSASGAARIVILSYNRN